MEKEVRFITYFERFLFELNNKCKLEATIRDEST